MEPPPSPAYGWLQRLLLHPPRGTRFHVHLARRAPHSAHRLRLLFETCGYDTRMMPSGDVYVRGAAQEWLAAPRPQGATVLQLLRRLVALDWPSRMVDVNDPRMRRIFEEAGEMHRLP